MKRGEKGFSLVELLVIVSLIAAFAAILAPVYLDARRSAARGRCQSNLRQLAQAFETYAADHAECYPNLNNQYLWAGFYWREPMRKYTVRGAREDKSTILACPSDPTPPGVYAGTSYAYSASFYMTPEQVNRVANSDHIRSKFTASNPELPCFTIRTSAVRHSGKKVLVAEYWTLHSQSANVGWYDEPETGNDPWSGARNYLFADGHVVMLAAARIHPAISPVVSRPRLLPDINLTTNGVAGKDID